MGAEQQSMVVSGFHAKRKVCTDQTKQWKCQCTHLVNVHLTRNGDLSWSSWGCASPSRRRRTSRGNLLVHICLASTNLLSLQHPDIVMPAICRQLLSVNDAYKTAAAGVQEVCSECITNAPRKPTSCACQTHNIFLMPLHLRRIACCYAPVR